MNLAHGLDLKLFELVSTGVFWLIYLRFVYFIFQYKNRYFTSYDKKPLVLHRDDILARDDDLKRVKTGLYIKGFPDFSIKNNNFQIDGIVWFECDKNFTDMEGLSKFEFENATSIKKSTPIVSIKDEKISIKFNVQIAFSSNLDHKLFPMNDHQLTLIMRNEYFLVEDVVFEVENSHFEYSRDIFTRDWSIIGKSAESGYVDIRLEQFSNMGILHPIVAYTLDLKKTGLRFASLIIMPIMVIFLISLSSLIPDNFLINKAVSLGSLTGLLAYRYIINTNSPPVGYFTFAEHIYNVAFCMVFINLVIEFNLKYFQEHPQSHYYFFGIYFIEQGIMLFSIYYLLFRWNPYREKKRVGTIRRKRRNPPGEDWLKMTNLNCIRILSQDLNKNVISDNKDLYRPVFSEASYHKYPGSYYLTWGKKKKFLFGSPDYVEELARRTREIDLLHMDTTYVLKIPVSDQSRVVIIGGISGSFHDLAEHMNELVNMKFMDEGLHVTKPDDYLIFNGNAIEGNPYGVEVLALIMALMLKNQRQVYYIRGNQESQKNIYNRQFIHEITHKLSDTGLSITTYEKFFSSLPLAIYLQYTSNEKHHIFRINSRMYDKFYEKNQCLRSFIKNFSNAIEHFPVSSHSKVMKRMKISLNDGERSEAIQGKDPKISPIQPDAIILGDDSYSTVSFGKPLRLFNPHDGTPIWNITSSFRLFHDVDTGFIMLESEFPGVGMQLSLFHHKKGECYPYRKKRYHLKYAFPIGKNTINLTKTANQDELVIGSTMDFSGVSKQISSKLFHGLYSKIIEQNKHGGILEKNIKLIVYDDHYSPVSARRNILRLTEHHDAKIILSPVGTVPLEGYEALIRSKKIGVMFPVSGGNYFRKPEFDNVFYLRPSYISEAKELTNFAVSYHDIHRISIFYQNDSYGKGVLKGIKETLDTLNLEWQELPYHLSNPDIERHAHRILSFKPEAILFVANAKPAIELIKELGIPVVANMTLISISYSATYFKEFLDSVGLRLIRTQVVPPLDSDLEIVREYHQSLRTGLIKMNASDLSLEGFINASLLIHYMSSIEPPFTLEKLTALANQTGAFEFKGLPLNMNLETRELSTQIWLDY